MNKEIKKADNYFERVKGRANQTKYKYYFFDYLYYRLYVGYRRHNEPARISSCLFLGRFV